MNETPPNNGIRLTSPTNDPSQLDHPDAAVWTKSPFSKKYKTHSVDSSKGNFTFKINLCKLPKDLQGKYLYIGGIIKQFSYDILNRYKWLGWEVECL